MKTDDIRSIAIQWICAVLFLLTAAAVHAAQVCNSSIEPTAPAGEFTINADGTATHQRTGLIWDRCAWGLSGESCENGAAGEYTWDNALTQPDSANAQAHKGHTDWRLPTKMELASLVEYQCHNPAINTEVFPAAPSSSFWSSSPNAYGSHGAWNVYFGYGYVYDGYKSGARSVRLVRGGQAFASFDFTKLDTNGNPLADSAGAWSCVKDNITNLIWEIKSDDSGLRDKDWTYTWHNSDSATNGGDAGTQNGGACQDGVCDTSGFVQAVNSQGLCGAHDWRMPDPWELGSIADTSRYSPAIDTDYFPDTASSSFWSSSPSAYFSSYAWNVSFYYGYVYGNIKSGARSVRLVRGSFVFLNQAPTAAFSLSPASGQAPLSVTLNGAASSDPDGDTLNYAWDASGVSFGNGAAQFDHLFAPGEYTITLTVTDAAELSAQASQTLSVTLPPPPQLPVEITLCPGQSQTVNAWTQAPPLTWVSANPATASVDANGTASALTPGGTSLSATDIYGQSNVMNLRVAESCAVENPVSAGRAILIAGGGAHQGNTLFRHTHRITVSFYRMLRSRGFSDADILLLDPLNPDTDGNGADNPEHRDFYLHDARADLDAAFARVGETLLAGQQFIFYLHGHGDPDSLKMNRIDLLSAAQLRGYLDGLPAGTGQIVILDTCYSGSFLDDLAAPGRIVLSAADAEQQAWSVEIDGFSNKLIEGLRSGRSLFDAFERSRATLNTLVFRHQKPQLDDDGDGQFTSRDGLRAQNIFFAGKGTGQDDPPDISRIHPRLELPPGSAREVLWLETSETQDQVRRVTAVLAPPGWQTPGYAGESTAGAMLEEREMLYSPAQQRYETVFGGFYQPGEWRVYYRIEGANGVFSDTMPGQISAPGVDAAVDVGLNLKRYAAGDRFRLDVSVTGTRRADLYVALLFPDGTLLLLSYPNLTQNPLLGMQPYTNNIDLSNTPPYGVFDFSMPSGVIPGNYTACAALLPVAVPLLPDGAGLLHFECEGFAVE